MKILLLLTDDVQEEMDVPDNLHLQQGLVGGYIKNVRVSYKGHFRLMVINEDGIRLRLPQNKEASRIANRPILGNAFVILEGSNG